MKLSAIITAIQLLAIGAALVAYAHANFSTKLELESLRTIVERIDGRVYDLAVKEGVVNGNP